MIATNPIILKELLQAARRKWTFTLRAALPLVAILLLAPQLINVLERSGQDWRVISRLAKSIFLTMAWLQLIAFSLMAFAFCSTTLHEEWRRKTMEVLCASPLSVAQVVYGKFLAVLGKLMMLALALLPVMGVWLHLGRMPREIVLGTFAIILGSVLLCGSFALLQAASYRTGRGYGVSMVSLILPYFLGLSLLDAYVWVRHPLLEAALAPRAFFLMLYGSPPAGFTPGGFALLSLGIHMGLAALALAVSPKIFARSFALHIGGEKQKENIFRRAKRFLRGRRPPMRSWQSPFYWVEKGPFSRPASRSGLARCTSTRPPPAPSASASPASRGRSPGSSGGTSRSGRRLHSPPLLCSRPPTAGCGGRPSAP